MDYDIIYSYLCHEDIDSFIDTIRNLFYFNKSQKILVIVNANDFMYNELKNKINSQEFINVKLYPFPNTKRIGTYDIFEAHINNFIYCNDNNFISKYFILLASNCLFHKFINMIEINNLINNTKKLDLNTDIISDNFNAWHWPNFFKNDKIIDIFIINSKNYNIKLSNKYHFIRNQHEGIILEYEIFNIIKKFMLDNKIKENIQNQIYFEEIFPVTLSTWLTGKYTASLCKVFWELPNYKPTLENINNELLPCVKRVERNYDDNIRKTIRENNNNYNFVS